MTDDVLAAAMDKAGEKWGSGLLDGDDAADLRAALEASGYTIVPMADVEGLDVERLAAALPSVSHALWSRSEAGDHQQVWFDEDVLRHFHEWAEDTAAVIAREYAGDKTMTGDVLAAAPTDSLGGHHPRAADRLYCESCHHMFPCPGYLARVLDVANPTIVPTADVETMSNTCLGLPTSPWRRTDV